MKTKLTYLLLLLLLYLSACVENKESQSLPEALFPQAQNIPLKLDKGYVINPTTGDSIKPLINNLGDTVRTGTLIPALGKIINPNSVSQPKVVPLSLPKIPDNAHSNVHKIPDDLTVRTVKLDSLNTILSNEIAKNDTTHYLINSIGNKVRTGISIPAKGKIVPTTTPHPTPAMPPGFKDNVIKNMQYLDVDQGMASSYIFSTLEDKNGNIWFGTNGGGVSKYDGASFTNFTTSEGLSNDIVTSILEDQNGNLWFGTFGGGVSKYDGNSFTHFTTAEGLCNDMVYALEEDQYGNLWFGTNGGGLSKYDGKSFTHFTTKEGLSSDVVRSILEDQNGNLWFGTSGGGVCEFDGKSFTHFTSADGLAIDAVYSILEDRKGNLWFGTWGGGVSRFDGESFTNFSTAEGLSQDRVTSILEDQSGNLWFGTFGGVSKYDGVSFTHITTEEGLTNNIVFSILEDQSGCLWFGTNGGGVNNYHGDSFAHFTTEEGLSNDVVYSILEDKNGDLWFGTYGGGVSKYNGETFTHFTTAEGLSSDIITSLVEDQKENLWLGTWGGGVCKYDGESITKFSVTEGLSHPIVYSMIEDQSGNLWFGTWGGGVCKYDGKSFTHFTTAEGLSNNVIRSILEDKDGNLWFGTNGGGVSKYDGEYFTHYTTAEGLSNNVVITITEDQSGNLWFGTFGGASKFDGKSFTNFTTEEGLSNDVVYSIREGENGNVWISTEKGLNEIIVINQNGKKSKALYLINQYVKSDGLKSLDYYGNSAWLDSKNRMWWGSGKSLTMLDINNHRLNSNPPSVHLKQLDINESFIDYRNIADSLTDKIEFNGVHPFENYPLNLELNYDQNHLTFSFVGIDWAAPHKIQYSYIMDGLDSKWSSSSSEIKADYRNLPYGTYTFKVCAIGESGKWSKPFEYKFTIHPPWWHTWWSRTIYVGVGLLILFLLFKWRTAKMKRRQRELETEVDIATKEIREQKEVVEQQKAEVEEEKNRSDELLLNILPVEIAEELKEKGEADTQLIDFVTVLFTDFKGFTALSEILSPQDLVREINICFSAFDHIMEKYNVEKIKTIGDAYMAAGGLPTVNETHAQDVVKAALEIQQFMLELAEKKKTNDEPFFEIRIGVHTGPVVAGIVGVKKFQYDIWGDTVNTASRMESSGSVGRVNISQSTYEIVKNTEEYSFESRGKIEAKGKGLLEMFFVEKR